MIEYNFDKDKLEKNLNILSLSRFAFGHTSADEFIYYDSKEETNEDLTDEDIKNLILASNIDEEEEEVEKVKQEVCEEEEKIVTCAQAKAIYRQLFRYFEASLELGDSNILDSFSLIEDRLQFLEINNKKQTKLDKFFK